MEVGGFKRLQALSVTLSAAMLLPWATIQLATQDTPIPSLVSMVTPFAVGLMQLADFYMTTIASQRVDHTQVGRIGSLVTFSSALLLASLSWYYHPVEEEHGLSIGVVMATIFFLIATATLTCPNPRSSSYSLVGYSSAGLPLYSAHRSVPSSLSSLVREGLARIMDDRNSRRIFYFLLLNLVGVVSYRMGVVYSMVNACQYNDVCGSVPIPFPRHSQWWRCCMECGPTVWVSSQMDSTCCLTAQLSWLDCVQPSWFTGNPPGSLLPPPLPLIFLSLPLSLSTFLSPSISPFLPPSLSPSISPLPPSLTSLVSPYFL